MEDLRQYAVFAQTATSGSMSAAARRLGMTPSAVSQTIRALEARTGVVLPCLSTLWSAVGKLMPAFIPAECTNCFAAAGYEPD